MYKERNFKFNICDIEKQIFEMSESRKLEERDLEIIAGGKMNNKFLASSLASLAILTSTGINTNINIKATNNPATSISDVQKSDENKQVVEYFTKQQVIEDIDYVMNKVKNSHVGCINGIPDEVLKQKELEIKNLSESTSSVEEWRIISSILAKLHDAHTTILPPAFLYGKRLPFDIEYLDNKIFCRSGEFKDSEITEINGVKISDLYEKFKLHYSYEIEEWVDFNFFRSTPFFEQYNLAKAGIDTFKPVEISFKTDKGIAKQKFEFIQIEVKFKKSEPFFYQIDKENSVGIFTINKCIIANKEFLDTVDKFFADVASNNIENVIVDLRRNTGGWTGLERFFARYLNKLGNVTFKKCEIRTNNGIETRQEKYTADETKLIKSDKNLFDGKLFILTSNLTFSSAMDFALEFSDNNLATIVGEVPGNSPNHYGCCNICDYTPNSKLKFITTTKKYYRADSTKDPNRLIPDVQVSAKEALNKVYELIKS